MSISASRYLKPNQTSFTFGAGLFGSIFGFAILKPFSTSAPSYLGSRYFGPKENNVVQAAASAAGSLGLHFTSGFPVGYQLVLHSQTRVGHYVSVALDAKRKTKASILSFCFAITLRIESEYAPGILWD
ncbi:hypothetical protein JVT61DRAFT_10356 [Boletus reticuloceps]|uniref:Uncharacterized protein n=1 Tax=Boletus reticuloceps TaxID=495285 RepID=A0A8I2YWB1_9AGAM|nr:hypothetical protein JVT61DRAFT_10356 [Boletus reticuloceps]